MLTNCTNSQHNCARRSLTLKPCPPLPSQETVLILSSYRNAFLVYIPVKRKTPGNCAHKSFFRKYLERNDGLEIVIPHNPVGNIIKGFFDFYGLIINKNGYVEIGIRASFSPDAGTKDDNSFLYGCPAEQAAVILNQRLWLDRLCAWEPRAIE